MEFAFEYSQRNMMAEFEKFLLAGKYQAKGSSIDNTDRHVLLLNTLAAYYIESAKSLKENETLPSATSLEEPRSVRDLLDLASRLVNEAERIVRLNKFTFLGKANIHLIKTRLNGSDDIEQALSSFRAALSIDPNFVPALIGLASGFFEKGNYRLALGHYQKVLTLKPDITPDPRIPIGICYYKLDMEDHARLAFERAIKLNPKNETATLFLSMLDFNKSQDASISPKEKRKLLKDASARVMSAYKLDPRNGLCAVQMAERFFDKDLHKANVMATLALKNTKSRLLQAEALAIKGRIAQKEKKYEEAFEYFKQAAAANPKSNHIQYSLSQLYAYKGDFENATTNLKNILKDDPTDYDTLKLLFSLYTCSPDSLKKLESIETKKEKGPAAPANVSNAQSVFESLKKMLRETQEVDGKEEEVKFSDPELLADIALFLEQVDILSSRKKYLELLDVLRQTNETISPELLNNIAVLYHLEADSINEHFDNDRRKHGHIPVEGTTDLHMQKALASANESYENAIRLLTDESFIESNSAEKVNYMTTIIRYNIARLFEVQGDIEKAKLHYQEILKTHPAFSECLLRLGYLASNAKNDSEALKYYSDVLALDPQNSMAWFMIANQHFKLKSYRAARKSFEKVLEYDKYNLYALSGAGNICLILANRDQNPANREMHFMRCIEFFCKCISIEKANAYAAGGLAIAYAEKAKYNESRDVSNQIMEAAPGNVQMTLNAAHVLVEQGQIHPAILLYESILKKGGQMNDVLILLSMSRAYYILSKTTSADPKDISAPEYMKSALKYISMAIHIDPSNKALYFNLALIQQQYCILLNDQPHEIRVVEKMQKALKDLIASEDLFNWLALPQKPIGDSKPVNPGYDLKKAKDRAEYSKGLKSVTEKKIHQTEVLARENHERLMEIKEQQRLQKLREEEEEARKKEEEARREAELEYSRRQLQLKMQEENERLANDARRREEDEEG
ncbi:hypothetical protein BC833DRAFT_575185 [Globomyces pollinis-pini]|nr:hypothetical protein BC833DRAFT_575185 [Globomyces pollinis-pini]